MRWGGLAAVLARGLVASVAAGAPLIAKADDGPASVEVWSGAQVTENSWYAYSGLVYAFGGDVLADGWLLRATGGGGAYSYPGRLPLQPLDSPDVDFMGDTVAGDVAIGYQQRFGAAIAKAFVGASYAEHLIVPEDVLNPVTGTEFGVVAAVETWIDVDDATWVSLGGSYSTAFSCYAANIATGYRLLPELSLGVEAGAFGNSNLDAGRIGALVKWDTAYGELTAAAGLSGDYADPSTSYGRASWLVRF
jgi:hypothetical protein